MADRGSVIVPLDANSFPIVNSMLKATSTVDPASRDIVLEETEAA